MATYYFQLWRKALGITISEISDALGKPDSFILELENYNSVVSQNDADKIAKTLDVSIEELKHKPALRDLRGGRMARIAQQAGQEAAKRAKGN